MKLLNKVPDQRHALKVGIFIREKKKKEKQGAYQAQTEKILQQIRHKGLKTQVRLELSGFAFSLQL